MGLGAATSFRWLFGSLWPLGSACAACPAKGIIDGPAARSPVRPKGTGGGPTTGTVKNRIRLSVILLIILL